MRILVVGAGSPNADMVSEVLNANGIPAAWTDKIGFPNPLKVLKCDVVYGIYLQTCSRYVIVAKLLGKKTIIHFVGSDAYWMARERSILRRMYWRAVLRFTDLVLYVSPHLQEYVHREGYVLPFPIAASEFESENLKQIQPDRDVLYYCPGGSRNIEIYRLQWIIDYAKQNPDKTISILGNVTHPARYHVNLPNVDVIPYVDRKAMPAFYRRHKKLIRMTTEDGLPRMLSEAILCGLEVEFNGQSIKSIPRERDPKVFASSLMRAIRPSPFQ